jgi:hypothetical protein
MVAVDLIAWTQHLLRHGDLAKAEPKTLRYRLLHVAARLTPDNAGAGCASSGPGPGPTTSPPRSPASLRCPRLPADLRARHDERREPPAEQHAGNSTTPILGNDTTKTDNPNHKITSRAS